MHDGYRLSAVEMRRLVEHVRGGGRFDHNALAAHDPEATPVFVTRFEDGRLMLRDGLHRSTAVLLGRQSGELEPGEVVVEDMTYEMFLMPALAAGLYAPFDPRTEVRIADFRAYRDEVERIARSGGGTLAYIAANRHSYVRPRQPCHDALVRFYAERSPYGAELAA